MKTILYCENNVDGTVGGSYYSLLYLASGLDRSRYRPIVLFYQDNPLIPSFREAGVETHVIPRPRGVTFLEEEPGSQRSAPGRTLRSVPRKIVNFFRLLAIPALGYRRCLRRNNVDLVHLNNSVLRNNVWMIAAFLARVPCITHERGINPRYSISAKILSRSLAAIICISDAVRASLLAGGIRHPGLRTIHNGLDPSKMVIGADREAVRTRHGIGPSDPVIGIVGNLKHWKGQQVVIEAMALLVREIPDLHCLLVGEVGIGDEPFEQELRERVASLGLERRVIFAGYQQNVADYVNAMDLLVHASVLPEPFGRVLLEGMALRKPVVASRAGGVPEIIVDGESGVLHTPGDHRELARKVAELVRDPDRAARIGEAGHARLCREFGIHRHVEQVQRLYESIL